MTVPLRVLVTAVSGGSVGEQIVKALRHGSHAYELTVTNTSRLAMEAISAEHHELLPPASSSDYVSSVVSLASAQRCDFIVPGSERELRVLSQRRNELREPCARLLANSHDVIALCLDKLRTATFLSGNGFRTPLSVAPSGSETSHLGIEFPVIVKPVDGAGGSAFAFVAQDQEELTFFTRYLRRYGYAPLVQAYVGEATEEYTVGVLHDSCGKLLGTSVMRRNILEGLSRRIALPNLTGRSDLGDTLAVSSGISQGEFVDAPSIRDECTAIAACLGSRGPLNIQGRWDGTRFVSFEINPRFSGTSCMRAMAGFNEVELLIDSHLHQRVLEQPRQPRLGKFTRGLVEHFHPSG